jgi:hypothetical protein
VTGSVLATVLGLTAAVRFRAVRAVGLFGVTLNLLYLLGFATFQVALLFSSAP